MKLKIFAVRDSKAEAFSNPMFFRTHGEAIRGFDTAVNDPETPFFKYPNDYTLFELGEFDQGSGVIEVLQQPRSHGSAFEFHKSNSQTTMIPQAVRS